MKRDRRSNEDQTNNAALNDNSSQSQNSVVIDYNRQMPVSNYEINLEEANNVYQATFEKLSDIFSSKIKLPNGEIISPPTHMLGQAEADIKLIAYNNDNEMYQEDIVRFIKPNEIAISIKHHSPKPVEKEKIKLQCTHIQIVVGVMFDGKEGVITVNNPQACEEGLFGAVDYPMIFIKPDFPSGLSNEKVIDYVNNIRTWLVLANTFTVFPPEYDGGDPLATRNVEQLKQLGDKLLDALSGDREAIDWLKSPLNMVYCAELAHVALNLGLHYPLNSRFIGGENFELLKEQLISKDFLQDNSNLYIAHVSLCVAPEDLEPITNVINGNDLPSLRPFDKNLAVKPFTVANIIQKFVQFSVPRKELGESVSVIQAVILKECQDSVFTQLGINSLSDDDEKKVFVKKLYEEIVSCVEHEYESYDKFKEAMMPLLDKAQKITSPRDNGEGAFIPPHCFLVRATEWINGRADIGLLKWQYVGHGLHESMLTKVC
ncbi:hypothetical protein ACFL49_00915 [Candidatus Omnitrophota bacterium]